MRPLRLLYATWSCRWDYLPVFIQTWLETPLIGPGAHERIKIAIDRSKKLNSLASICPKHNKRRQNLEWYLQGKGCSNISITLHLQQVKWFGRQTEHHKTVIKNCRKQKKGRPRMRWKEATTDTSSFEINRVLSKSLLVPFNTEKYAKKKTREANIHHSIKPNCSTD